MLKKLNIGVGDAISFAGLAISLICWFGVTPERFGQMAFDVAQIVIPVLTLGLVRFLCMLALVESTVRRRAI